MVCTPVGEVEARHVDLADPAGRLVVRREDRRRMHASADRKSMHARSRREASGSVVFMVGAFLYLRCRSSWREWSATGDAVGRLDELGRALDARAARADPEHVDLLAAGERTAAGVEPRPERLVVGAVLLDQVALVVVAADRERVRVAPGHRQRVEVVGREIADRVELRACRRIRREPVVLGVGPGREPALRRARAPLRRG